ncbi:MAG: HEAT repeat domain-containing protein [Gemmataceae bacterium]
MRCPSCKAIFNLAAPPPPKPKTAVIREVPAAPPPRAEPRSSAARRRNDDDDDSPRRRKKSKESSNGPVLAIVALVAVLLIVGGVVVGIFAFGGKKETTGQQVVNNVPERNVPPGGIPPMSSGPGSRPAEPSRPATPTKPADSSGDSGGVPVSTASSGSVQEIYDYVLKSTVLIFNVMPRGLASGTGSVVDANERLILTNYHVVAHNEHLVVFFPTYENGKPVAERDRYMNTLKEKIKTPADLNEAEVIAMDPARDLALVRVPKIPAGTETLPLAKGMVTIGQTVHSVGNPGASGALWVYTQGAVRSIYRNKWKIKLDEELVAMDSEVVETQSPTNHGDSGGPLVNERGEMVGVTEGGSAEGHLISLFISVNEARNFIEREYQRKFNKPWKPVGRSALRIRSGGGGDVTTLINALDHKDAKNRASAAKNLGEMGPDAKLAIRRLVKALKDPDELTSRCAAEALTKIGAPGKDDLPALLEAIKDPKVEVRRYASAAIGQIGPEASKAAQPLVDALIDTDEQVRENLVRSLGSLGAGAKAAALPGLTKALEDSSKTVRVAAASSLTNLLSPLKADDVPVLVTILKQQDAEARLFGARGLSKLGKQAKAALPELMEAAKNTDPVIRREAIDSLAAVGPDAKSAIPLYLAALKDSNDGGVRQSALLALGQLGKDVGEDKDAVAAVLEAIKDPDAQVKKAALTAVGKLGPAIGAPGAKQAMPTLIDMIQSKDTATRDEALDTIAGLGPLAKEAINPLISLMEKQDIKLYVERTKSNAPFLHEADDALLTKIAKSIGKIGKDAVKPLLRSFNLAGLNFNAGLVIGSCRALGEIGPTAKDAVSHLNKISANPELPSPLRSEADRAVRKIQTK